MLPSSHWLVGGMTGCLTRSSRCFNTVSNENHLQENTTRPSGAFQSNRNLNAGTHRGGRAVGFLYSQDCNRRPAADDRASLRWPIRLVILPPTAVPVNPVSTG